jgi:hypothetical protein
VAADAEAPQPVMTQVVDENEARRILNAAAVRDRAIELVRSYVEGTNIRPSLER